MKATQDSFSKMVNPLLDKKRAAPKKAARKTTRKVTEEPTDSFENYLR